MSAAARVRGGWLRPDAAQLLICETVLHARLGDAGELFDAA